MRGFALASILAAACAVPGAAWAQGIDMSQYAVGGGAEELPELSLGDGESNDFLVSEQTYNLVVGEEYSLTIVARGFQEYGIEADEFFDAIEVDEIVVGEVEIAVEGLSEIELGQEGEIEFTFTPTRAGTFAWSVPAMAARNVGGEFVVAEGEAGATAEGDDAEETGSTPADPAAEAAPAEADDDAN